MSYEYVKAVCLFCNATVEGNQRFMLGGKSGKQGPAPKWLRDKQEHKWQWNGLTGRDGSHAIFYLCPEHGDNEHYRLAFNWAEEHTKC